MPPNTPQFVSSLLQPKPRTRRLRRQRRGQTLVEYALIIAVIAVVAIGVLVTLGQQTKGLFSAVSSQISRAGS